ncbi:MAG: hypothetical protein ACR2KT_17955 [Methylocella sp.]
MNHKTVLISGAGIAGPTLAFWLKAAGFEPTLIERAPALRTGGYVIDFWGLGYDIAERMGLARDINRIGYHVREMRIVDDRGKRVTGFGTKVFGELTDGRYVTLGRSDLSRLLFEKVKGTTEGHLEKYPFRAASKSDSKNLFEFDQWERCDGAIGFL